MYKVLIADDESIIRRTIHLIGDWEKNGMEISGEVKNGIEAMEFLEHNKVDLIILDMKMPGYTGDQIIHKINEHGYDCYVIVVSGYDEFKYAQTAVKYGAIDYILKPIDRSEFNRALEKVAGLLRANEQEIVPIKKNVAQQVKEKIDKNYSEELSLEGFAREFYVNKDALSRLFKKTYGIGFSSYLNDVRLKHAKHYLLQGYSVSETATLVGYNDMNYFSRVFKKMYGISPSGYNENVNQQ